MKSNPALKESTFSFDELSPDAKEIARQWWRDLADGDEMSAVIEDAAECANILGIDVMKSDYARHQLSEAQIFWSGFCCQGDGASFAGRYLFRPEAITEIRQHAGQDTVLHAIADELHRLSNPTRLTFCGGAITLEGQDWHTDDLPSPALGARIKQSGNYCHSGTMTAETYYDETGDDAPGEIDDAVQVQMRAFADWIYGQLKAEDEYQSTDDYIDEQLKSYEFTEDGEAA